MTARASFSGLISFSMVAFSVKAYAMTVEKEDPEFHILHKACKTPVKMPYHCKYCGVLVNKEDTTKGFEHGGGWVALDDAALAGLEPEREDGPRTFRVQQTLSYDHMPSPNKSYWLVPGSQVDEKSYALFRRALTAAKLAALVVFDSHGKTHLAVVHPSDEGLTLTTVYYPTQVRSMAELGLGVSEIPLSKKENALAVQLLEGLHRDFNPQAYPDANQARRLQVVNAVLAQKPIPVTEYQQPQHITSLMEALEASIKALPKRKKAKR